MCRFISAVPMLLCLCLRRLHTTITWVLIRRRFSAFSSCMCSACIRARFACARAMLLLPFLRCMERRIKTYLEPTCGKQPNVTCDAAMPVKKHDQDSITCATALCRVDECCKPSVPPAFVRRCHVIKFAVHDSPPPSPRLRFPSWLFRSQ